MHSTSVFKFVSAFAAIALLAGCASSSVRECNSIAGPGWTAMSAPPPNAAELLQLNSVPRDQDLIWLSKGDQNLLVCDYSSGLIIPGCSGSTAYEYERREGHWVSRGQLLDACNSEIETK